MKILQISDTHLDAPGVLLAGRDPLACLDRAIADVNETHADADLAVISGDLTNHGAPATYDLLADRLAMLRVPYRLTLGNHDDRAAFAARFPEALDENGFAQSVTDLGEIVVIVLDSLSSGEVGGRLDGGRLDWLAAQLAARPTREVWVFLHHPPMPIGIAAADACGLWPEDAAALAQICRDHGGVRLIGAGHVHRPSFSLWQGLVGVTVRSTCHQTALLLGGPFASTPESPGYTIYLTDAASGRLSVHLRDLV